jgi:hypothetical protein
MNSTRRGFFRRTVVAGTVLMFETEDAFGQADCTLVKPPAPTRFIPNEDNVVERISAGDLANPARAAQLKQFRDAIGTVQALPAADVIGWTKQIAQHCVNCAQSDQNNIHFNWQFLTWHRALLYFLERTLRKLPTAPGSDSLRLVYWDWENKASRMLPDIYAPQGQPLYWGSRGNLKGPDWPLADHLVDVQPSLGIPDFSTFGGTAIQGKPVPSAFSGPHALVHDNFDPGDMADLQYSPRDPVFYAHHCNIDRLWSSWVAAGHSNPDFGDAKVYFYDETRTWRFILMNDLKDEQKLGYKYSSLMQPGKPSNQLKTFTFNRTGNQVAPVTASSAIIEMARVETQPFFLYLQNIQNLEKLGAGTVRYGVFTAQRPAGTAGTAEAGFLGMFARVKSSGHHHIRQLSAALNVTGKMSLLLPAGKMMASLWVSPMSREEKTTGPGIPLISSRVSVSG